MLEWIPAFFNLYDKSLPKNQTKLDEIDLFRTISKVLVYVFCSKRIDFRAILRNTLGTLVDSGLSAERVVATNYKTYVSTTHVVETLRRKKHPCKQHDEDQTRACGRAPAVRSANGL